MDQEELRKPEAPRPPRRGRVITEIAIWLILLAGAFTVGWYFSHHKTADDTAQVTTGQITTPESTSNTQTAPATNTAPSAPVAPPAVEPRSTPAPVPVTTKTYTNSTLHFKTSIKSNWTVKTSSDEIVFLSPQGQRYSVQMYDLGGGDNNALRDYLNTLPNLHNVTPTTLNGYDAFVFNVDGFYQRGYALLINGRLYYLLGRDIEHSIIASNFKAI